MDENGGSSPSVGASFMPGWQRGRLHRFCNPVPKGHVSSNLTSGSKLVCSSSVWKSAGGKAGGRWFKSSLHARLVNPVATGLRESVSAVSFLKWPREVSDSRTYSMVRASKVSWCLRTAVTRLPRGKQFDSSHGPPNIMAAYANLATRLRLERNDSRFESEGSYQISPTL